MSELIAQGLPISISLGLAAVLLALLLGVPLGILAALRATGAADHVLRTIAALGIAMPSFVTGPLFALVFGDIPAVAAGGRLGLRRSAVRGAAGRHARIASAARMSRG